MAKRRVWTKARIERQTTPEKRLAAQVMHLLEGSEPAQRLEALGLAVMAEGGHEIECQGGAACLVEGETVRSAARVLTGTLGGLQPETPALLLLLGGLVAGASKRLEDEAEKAESRPELLAAILKGIKGREVVQTPEGKRVEVVSNRPIPPHLKRILGEIAGAIEAGGVELEGAAEPDMGISPPPAWIEPRKGEDHG